MLEEEMTIEKGVEHFPANAALICPCVPEEYFTIKILTEALRRHPRGSHEGLEVCSPLILNLVRCLFALHLLVLGLWGQSLFRP